MHVDSNYPVGSGAEHAEVVTDQDMVCNWFKELGVEDLLRKFAFGQPFSEEDPRIVNEGDIDYVLGRYSQYVAVFALRQDKMDVPLIKMAFETIITSMNSIGNEKLGYKKPRSVWQGLLTKVGIRDPEQRTYFSGLDERYWTEQFPWEHREERVTKRRPDESDKSYLARHIQLCFHGFALAPFSYIQQATCVA